MFESARTLENQVSRGAGGWPLLVLLTVIFSSPWVYAEPSVETLYAFGKAAYGYAPGTAPILAQDGSVYGTTAAGGKFGSGTIFRINRGGKYTVLYNFDGTKEGSPASTMTLAPDGSLYGFAGTSSQTVIYRLDPQGQFTALTTFERPSYAYSTEPPLAMGPDGIAYGVVTYDARYPKGAVFGVSAKGQFRIVHEFTGAERGTPLPGLLATADGSLYGTMSSSERDPHGSVYKLDAAGHFSVLVNFEGDGAGSSPRSGLIMTRDGTLYGTTTFGGQFGNGTLYKVDKTGEFTVVHSFRHTVAEVLGMGKDGAIYGLFFKGDNRGFVYRVSTAGKFRQITPPKRGLNRSPYELYSYQADGNFYVASGYSGTGLAGQIVRIDRTGDESVLHTFHVIKGSYPSGKVNVLADGTLVGTCHFGGRYGYGTVYSINKRGKIAILHDFDRSDGAYPVGGMSRAPDGSFFGRTAYGGQHDYGVIYKLAPQGDYQALHHFDVNNGYFGHPPLSVADDGSVFGTTSEGGKDNFGSVFKIDPAGGYRVLHNFEWTRGAHPSGGVTLGFHGNLFGTTTDGGRFNKGTVFRLQADGTYTVLRNFKGPDGASPMGGVTVTPDGSLLGTTSGGGPKQSQNADGGGMKGGTVYRIDAKRKLTTLYAFATEQRGTSQGGPTLAANGSLYIVASDNQSVYRLDAQGRYKELYHNNGYINPDLTLGPDGNLYGSTGIDPSEPGGTLFRILKEAL